MRRTLFYLSIALFAFGIGSFVVFKFYLHSAKNSIITQTVEKTNIEDIEPFQNNSEEKVEVSARKIDFKCTDEILSLVWKEMRKDEPYRKAEDNFADCSELIAVSEMVDLNGDGVDEAVVVGVNPFINGMRGNKSNLFCQKFGKDYKIIFREAGQKLEIKKGTTNGYRDVLIKYRDDCCSFYETTYKFRKGKYRENKCSYINYGTTGVKKVSTCPS